MSPESKQPTAEHLQKGKLEFISLRLMVYKTIIFIMVAIYLKLDHFFFDMGKILEYVLIILTITAFLVRWQK